MNFPMEKDHIMSQEDFQDRLWLYLEGKGVFLNLKTELRKQLIKILKDSTLEEEFIIDQKFKRNLSPKYKGMNLLIADYLLHQGYQYALSVFSSEDPTLSTIVDRTRVTKFHTSHAHVTTFKFTDSDVFDILESLGFSAETEIAKEVHDDYVHSMSEHPLLLCLLKCLSRKSFKYDSNGVNVSEIKTCVERNEISESSQNSIEKIYLEMKIAFDKELDIFKESEKSKYAHLIEVHDECFKNQLKEIVADFNVKKSRFKKKLINKLKLEQEKLLKREQLREAEIERGLQEDLNREKEKLSEKFRLIHDNKNLTSETLIEVQQSSLEIALKAVQHQSSRLRRREERLNRKMNKMIQMSNKEMISFACQVSSDTENCLSDITVNKSNKIVQTDDISKNSVGCQININKSVEQLPDFKICKSFGCQTEDVEVFLNMDKNYKEIEKLEPKKIDSPNSFIENQPDVTSSNLQFENTYLKVYNQQQRQHIQDLIKKQTSLFDELKAANSENANLGQQLITLKKLINSKIVKENSEIYKIKRGSILYSSASKVQKRNFEAPDCEIDTIKKTLQSLEKQSEDVIKSFNDFKRRQSETKSPIFKTPMKEVIMKTPVFKSNYETNRNDSFSVKDISTHTYDYLNHLYLDDSYNSSSNCNLKRVYGSAMNLSNDVLQNYIDTSLQYSNYDVKNPKAFADKLVKHNVSKSIEDIPSYSKANFDKIINSKYGANENLSSNQSMPSNRSRDFDYILTSRSDVINAEMKNASFESRRNNLLRRWSLPSLVYKKSPLSQKFKNRPDDKLKLFGSPEAKKLKFNDYLKRRLFTNDGESNPDKLKDKESITEKIAHVKAFNERIHREISLHKDSKINVIEDVKSTSPKFTQNIDKIESCVTEIEKRVINPSAPADKLSEKQENETEVVDRNLANSTFIDLSNKTAADFFVSLNLSNISDDDSIHNQENKNSKNSIHSENINGEVKVEELIKFDENAETPVTDSSLPKMLKENGIKETIMIPDNPNKGKNEDSTSNKQDSSGSSVISEEILVPSSLEMTDHSHISIPNVSEENDSFWK